MSSQTRNFAGGSAETADPARSLAPEGFLTDAKFSLVIASPEVASGHRHAILGRRSLSRNCLERPPALLGDGDAP
jgi:hypothetical protein